MLSEAQTWPPRLASSTQHKEVLHTVDVNDRSIQPVRHGPEANSGWFRWGSLSPVRQLLRVVPPPPLWSTPASSKALPHWFLPLVSWSPASHCIQMCSSPLFKTISPPGHAHPPSFPAILLQRVAHISHFFLTLHICLHLSEAFDASHFLDPENQLFIKAQRLHLY